MRFRSLVRVLFDRRRREVEVPEERRARRPSRREIDERLFSAVGDFEHTVRMKRDELLKFTSNDFQAQVQFMTLQEICSLGIRSGEFRLCRHKSHEAANTGIAKCDESLCPLLKGSAA